MIGSIGRPSSPPRAFFCSITAGGTRAGRLDGGVKRQQGGLGGNRLDQLHYHADAFGGGGEAADGAIGERKVTDRPLGRILGGRHHLAGACDQRQQLARRDADGLHVAGGVGRGLGRIRGAHPHVLAALAQVGSRDPDLFTRFVEGGSHLVDDGTELLGDEGVAREMELGFRFTAAVGHRKRIGIDQGVAHPLCGGCHLGHGPAADALRQLGIAIAGGDLSDGFGDRTQAALRPPRRRQARQHRYGGGQRQAFGGPPDRNRQPGRE
jgi:hypothetical protein